MSHRSSRSWGSGGACEAYTLPAEQHRVICPLATQLKAAVNEPGTAAKGIDNSLKAYKLGKRRWSYNQCQLIIQQEDGDEQLNVLEAMANGNESLPGDHQESGVVYLVRLTNGQRVKVHIFVVYDDPQAIEHAAKPGEDCYQWTCVQRSACKKGCEGPILRAIQRYGRLGRRSGGPETLTDDEPPATKSGRQRSKTSKAAAAASASARKEKDHELKDARFMYLSIDEASTHVGVRYFRLLVGVYTQDGECLLGTSVSNQIRVLANNDVPTGAAFIPLVVPVAHNWEGWAPVPPRSRRERVVRNSRYSTVSSPGTPSTRSPTKEHTRSQSSSDTSHPRHALPESPEMRSAHRRQLPPPLAGAGLGLDAGGMLDMQSAIGAGPASVFSAAYTTGLEPLQLQGLQNEDALQHNHDHHPLPPPLLHITTGGDHGHLLHHSRSHSHDGMGLPVPGSARRSSGISGTGFGTLHLQSSPSMDTSSCRWTVSPNVHTSMSSMARTNSGNGSFKRSRSGVVASPDGSGSPFKGSAPPSLSPSPVENPAGELSPFKGGGAGGGTLSPTMQQRRQAALHAHLVRQRLAAEAAADQHQQQVAAAEQGGQGLQSQHSLPPRHLVGTGSRLPPSHVHAPAGTQFRLDGGPFRLDEQALFYSARSLPAHLYHLQEDHNDVLLPQIFHDTEAGDSHFSHTLHNNISASTSPSLQAFGLPGTLSPDAEWLLPSTDIRTPVVQSPPEAADTPTNAGGAGAGGASASVSAISLPPISSGFLDGRATSLEMALTDSMLQGPVRSAGEERFGPLSPDV